MKWILISIGVLIIILLLTSISYRWGSYTAIKEFENNIKQKDYKIRQLEEQLKFYEQEIKKREETISRLRKQRQEIKKPLSDEEVINRFKALGYDITIYYK